MDGTEILRQHNAALDRTCANVMPDRWTGHGRLEIFQNEDLSPEQRERALDALENLSEDKPELFDKHGAERVANTIIGKLV